MMAFSRYARAPVFGISKYYGTSTVSTTIRDGIDSGAISYNTIKMSDGSRLDTLAGQYYGDSSYWWIIAAASGIGWGLQVPPGVELRIPKLDDILKLIG